MAEHDAALEWAKSNPDDPRAQDVMAKAWASNNPDDPRSAQILEKFKPTPRVGDEFAKSYEESMQKLPLGIGTAIKAIPAFRSGLVKGASMGNVSLPQSEQLEEGHPIAAGTGKVAGGLATGFTLGASLPVAETAMGRIGMGAATGGGLGFAEKPQDTDSLEARALQASKGAGYGLLLGGGIEGASKLGPKILSSMPQSAEDKLRNIGDTIAKYTTGRDIPVNPGQFKGTSAEEPLREYLKRSGSIKEYPHDVISGPVKAQAAIIGDQTLNIPTQQLSHPVVEEPLGAIQSTNIPSSFAQKLKEGLGKEAYSQQGAIKGSNEQAADLSGKLRRLLTGESAEAVPGNVVGGSTPYQEVNFKPTHEFPDLDSAYKAYTETIRNGEAPKGLSFNDFLRLASFKTRAAIGLGKKAFTSLKGFSETELPENALAGAGNSWRPIEGSFRTVAERLPASEKHKKRDEK